MRSLVNYFRQVFCKHDWTTTDGIEYDDYTSNGTLKVTNVNMVCKKCKWHRDYIKYL
jgi:hypothetical protein